MTLEDVDITMNLLGGSPVNLLKEIKKKKNNGHNLRFSDADLQNNDSSFPASYTGLLVPCFSAETIQNLITYQQFESNATRY